MISGSIRAVIIRYEFRYDTRDTLKYIKYFINLGPCLIIFEPHVGVQCTPDARVIPKWSHPRVNHYVDSME